MAIHPVRCGGYLLLAVAGWAAGRWVWPGERAVVLGENREAAGSRAGEVRSPAGPGHPQPVTKTAAVKVVDGKAAGLEMRASGSDDGFRDRARQLALEPPPALTDFLAAVTDSEVVRVSLLEDAVVWAYCREPAAGLALVTALPGSAETGAMVKKMLRFFPPKDLPVLQAWYAKLPHGEVKAAALREMLPALCRRDFGGAVALVTALPQDDGAAQSRRRDLLQELVTKYAPDTSYQGMLAGLSRFPERDRQPLEEWARLTEMKRLMFVNKEQVVGMLTSLHPIAQAAWAADVFQTWAGSDPIRAVPHLKALPDHLKTDPVYSGFAKKWAEGNVGMASQWVKDLPEGPPRQAAIKGLAAGLTRDYPVEAMTWAGTLADPPSRLSAIQSILDGAGADFRPDLVEALLKQPLSQEEKANLKFPATP